MNSTTLDTIIIEKIKRSSNQSLLNSLHEMSNYLSITKKHKNKTKIFKVDNIYNALEQELRTRVYINKIYEE